MSFGSHIKQMLLGAAAIFGVLLLAGIPVWAALTYSLLLACPLMMVWMMFGMKHGGHGGHGGHGESDPTRHPDEHAEVRLPTGPSRDRR